TPGARVPENIWQKTLIQLRDEYSVCPQCGEQMYTPWSLASKVQCDCGQSYRQPIRLNVKGYHVPMFQGQKLYACHTVESSDSNSDYATLTGEVTSKKSDPSQLGIRNLSEDTWTYVGQKGETQRVVRNGVVPVLKTDEIRFNKVFGRIGDGKALLSVPLCLFVKQYKLPLIEGQQIFACHTIASSDDMTIVTGRVTSKKSDPTQLGIQNLSDDEWTFIATSTGEQKSITKGKIIPIPKDIAGGIMVNFKGVSGTIAKK
ncbi:MAG: hypothetical protein LBU17_05360, partial [Treponema sp.]|nr:hypothetical protein [Treponema sp.]